MTRLDHRAPAATHAVDPVLHAGCDDADQGAGDEHAEQGDEERQDPSAPTDVVRHRAGVEDAQQRLPVVLEPSAAVASGERDAEQRQERSAEHHGADRHDAQPGERCRGASSEHVVESVTEAFAQAHLDRCAVSIGGAGHVNFSDAAEVRTAASRRHRRESRWHPGRCRQRRRKRWSVRCRSSS